MRWIVTLISVLLIATAVLGLGWIGEGYMRRMLTAEVESRLLMEARHLAASSVDALLSDFPELTLCPLVHDVSQGREDLAFAVVLDHERHIQGHADPTKLGRTFSVLGSMSEVPVQATLRPGESILADDRVLTASVPVTHANGQIVGTALVGLRRDYLEAMVKGLRSDVMWLTLLLMASGVLVTFLLMSNLLKPVSTLRQGLERIGRGDLDTPLEERGRTEIAALASTVNDMASQLKTSREQMLEKERLSHEMALAHRIQQSLLPSAPLEADGFVLAGRYRAASEVGGDYYDFFPLPGGRTGLVIADVSGKGLGGCMVTSMLAALIHGHRDQYTSPRSLLLVLERSLNRSLARGTFITMFYGVLERDTGHFTYASAGHLPLLVYQGSTGQTQWLRSTGVPLGVGREKIFESSLHDHELQLEEGDLLLQFTDGLSEAWNEAQKEELGFERVVGVVQNHALQGPQSVLDALEQTVQKWSHPNPPADDLTLLTLYRCPARVELPEPAHALLRNRRRLKPDEHLREMLSDLSHISLPADLREMRRLRPWLESCPILSRITSDSLCLIETVLHEICSNITEHGYHLDASQKIDLWWVPTPSPMADSVLGEALGLESMGSIELSQTLGYFILTDRAESFDPGSWTPVDLADPKVRRNGRGFGLQMVHSITTRIQYCPNTPAGNITMLRFDAQLASRPAGDHMPTEEVRHG